MNKIILETSRVILTEMSKADQHYLADLDSDPEVMKYLTGGRPSTEKELNKSMERILALKERFGEKFGIWLAFEKSTQEFMGWFLFRPDKKNPDDVLNPELGYRLKKKFWGKGYASEVSKALIERGFKNFKLESIFAITMKDNLASQAVMKKVGMSFVEDYVEKDFPGENQAAVRFKISAK